MSEPSYTVYIRVPAPRGDFVDPPPVNWDSTKDEALWKILSGAAQTEIDWGQVAERFDVSVDFLLHQTAYLTERHTSQVRAQVRKASAAVKGSATPSPVPGVEPAASVTQRATSALSTRRDSTMSRAESTKTGATTMPVLTRPPASRDVSGSMAALKEGAGSSSHRSPAFQSRPIDASTRRNFSSLPTSSPTKRSPEPQTESHVHESASPSPAASSSNDSSDDESDPVQSLIIRRPPRFQQGGGGETYQADGDDESEPAFQPFQASDHTVQDLGSTLKDDGAPSSRRSHKKLVKGAGRQPQTSDDSSSGSPVTVRKHRSQESKGPGPTSSNRSARAAGQSPMAKGKGKVSSRECSEGTPSMGSSFSDLDDTSVTQSAMEEALASHMNGPGTSSRFSVFKSRYLPGSNW